jgi:hypothetical protein
MQALIHEPANGLIQPLVVGIPRRKTIALLTRMAVIPDRLTNASQVTAADPRSTERIMKCLMMVGRRDS